jgi:hypothetical protein
MKKKTQSKLSKLQSTSYTATAASEATAEIKHLLELPKDVYNEIERLIGRIVVPYVDPSNPALHFDELMAECKAKLARPPY